jgi:hypothetical protein
MMAATITLLSTNASQDGQTLHGNFVTKDEPFSEISGRIESHRSYELSNQNTQLRKLGSKASL